MCPATTPESPIAWSAADRTDGSEVTTVRARRTSELFARAAAASNAAERKLALDEVIVLNMGLAEAIASRYRRRGIAVEDLRQVAYLALTRAAQRFDPARAHRSSPSRSPPCVGRYASTSAITAGWCARRAASKSCNR